MEINVKKIMSRMDLRQIRNFAFDEGLDAFAAENSAAYEDHIKEGSALILKRLNTLYTDDPSSRSDAMLELTSAVRAYRDVYVEIGMKIGARLLFQLLFQDD